MQQLAHPAVMTWTRLHGQKAASELAQLKDYFSKLKFNYLELETKRLFLQHLRGPLPSRHSIAQSGSPPTYPPHVNMFTELEMEENKKKLKNLKAANEKLTNDIVSLLNTLTEGEFRPNLRAIAHASLFG